MAIDEESPLLWARNASEESPSTGPTSNQVDAKDDVDNPITWPQNFKWTIVALLSFMAFTV